MLCSGMLVAQINLISTGMDWFDPTRVTWRDCNALSNLLWRLRLKLPISSRKSVPLLASSNLPGRSSRASVKAPFLWPNSSDSNRVSVIAPMSTETKLLSCRSDRWWIARAINSLPVPFSPRIKTLASVRATLSINANTFLIATLSPIMSPKGLLICSSSISLAFLSLSTSLYDFRSLIAVLMVATSFSFCQGFKMKSVAPCLSARTAISTSPNAVMRITTACGSRSRICSSQ